MTKEFSMNVVFYISAGIAVVSTLMVITRLNAVHALIYLIISLLAVAVVFYTLGAPFAAALEIIIYAGAIMVLFVFVVMMLNLGPATLEQERSWLRPKMWFGPSVLAAVLLAELIYMIGRVQPSAGGKVVGTKQLGLTLFGPYLLGVELASMLLLAGLVGAYHLGLRPPPQSPQEGE
jgi:NADH-quinone oxidoreductase subunit J